MRKYGFTLVELMVVIAIVAILAAIALPMYSTFKQKSKVGGVLQSLQGARSALQGWFDDENTFSAITSVPANGGALRTSSGVRIGAGLSAVEGVVYNGEGDSNSFTVTFTWESGSGCPNLACDTTWQIVCDATNDICRISANVGDGSLGLSF